MSCHGSRALVRTFVLGAILVGLGTSETSAATGPALRAGVAKVSITVANPTVPVHDPLFVKALVVDDGHAKAVILGLDIGGVSGRLVSPVRERLKQELGIEPASVLINASHNHHTQGQVVEDVIERIVSAVRQALETMVPVRVGAGEGREDRIMMNRRLRLEDGKEWTIRRANPSPSDSDVKALGPVDPEIGILRLDRTTGETLAVVYNFASHAYGGVPSGHVTADFPGFASAVLEEALGNGAVAVFLQGFAGNITPIRYKDVDAPPPTEQLGTRLGLSTLKAVSQIVTKDAGPVRVVSETIELPRRKDAKARIQSLETQQEKILQFFTGIGCGTHGAGTFLNFKTFLPLYMKHTVDLEHPSYSAYLYQHEEATGQSGLTQLDEENGRRMEKYLQSLQNMERLIRIRSNLQAYKRHLKRGDSPIAVEVQGIRIGDFVLITFPGEPFVEVGLRIKEQSPFEHTFVAGYSNGHLGYAPTTDAYESEAYEDALTPFSSEWQAIYETAALRILQQLGSEAKPQ